MPKQEKLLAVWMYAHRYPLRTIAKFFKTKRSIGVRLGENVCKKNNYSKPAPIDDIVVIELDDMWHFFALKKDEFVSGKPTAEQ